MSEYQLFSNPSVPVPPSRPPVCITSVALGSPTSSCASPASVSVLLGSDVCGRLRLDLGDFSLCREAIPMGQGPLSQPVSGHKGHRQGRDLQPQRQWGSGPSSWEGTWTDAMSPSPPGLREALPNAPVSPSLPSHLPLPYHHQLLNTDSWTPALKQGPTVLLLFPKSHAPSHFLSGLTNPKTLYFPASFQPDTPPDRVPDPALLLSSFGKPP